MAVTVFTNQDFTQDVLAQKGTVLVDFWAAWCGPCRMVAPVVEQLSREYEEKVQFGKVNIDEYPELAAAYQVQSIPTLLLIQNGVEVGRLVGAYPRQEIVRFLDGHL